MRVAKITGTGRYLPETFFTNDELSKYVETSDEWIYSRTGIKKRHIAVNEKTFELGAKAAANALESANVSADEIDLIVVATVSAEYSMPSIACLIQNELGAHKAMCFDMQAACSGFVYGLDIINQFLTSGKFKKALLIGVEKLSQILNWEDRTTCVLFGDGAGAVVLESVEVTDDSNIGIIDVLNKSIGQDHRYLVSKINHHDTPFYKQEEKQFLTMEGREVFQFACTKVPECIEELLSQNHIEIQDIDKFVLHQANERIITKIAKKLDQEMDKFYLNISEYGNTSSATVPIALDELWKANELQGKKVVLAGFGAGLTYGAAVIQF